MRAVLLAAVITPQLAHATNFTVGTGTTTTAAQTLSAGQTGTVASGGTLAVTGNNVAISVTGNATIVNNGTIQQTSVLTGSNAGNSRAIRDNTGGLTLTLTNGSATNSAALIQTADADVIQMKVATSSVTVNNYGTMSSLNSSAGGNQVIDWTALTGTGSNTLNNFATGVITASEADAVRPGVNGFINNAGIIKSTTSTGSSSDGIDAQTNTGITIVNANNAGSGTGTGLIEGGRHGITGGNIVLPGTYAMSITNNLGGTIQGDNGSGINIDGLNGNEVVTVVNHGTITGNGVTGDGDGIDVDGILNLTNTGTIKSLNAVSATGIAASEGLTIGGGTIVNSGLIEGDVAAGNTNAIGRGVSFLGNDVLTGPLTGTREAIYGNATLTNQAGGVIRGQNDSAIAVDGPASGFTVTITNQAGGLMEGGGATAATIQTGADNDIVTNAGTIRNIGGNTKTAVNLGAGDDHLIFTDAAPIVVGGLDGGLGGKVNGDVLTVNLDHGSILTLDGAIKNFEKIEVLAGSLVLNGQLTLAINGTAAASPTGFGQVIFSDASGTLTLGAGSTLELLLGFTPTFGQTFDLVNFANGSLVGMFAGLAEGSVVTSQDGQLFSISYLGGISGHDIVITAIPEPASYAQIAGALAVAGAAVWRRRRTA